jgi:hypothetical protein
MQRRIDRIVRRAATRPEPQPSSVPVAVHG